METEETYGTSNNVRHAVETYISTTGKNASDPMDVDEIYKLLDRHTQQVTRKSKVSYYLRRRGYKIASYEEVGEKKTLEELFADLVKESKEQAGKHAVVPRVKGAKPGIQSRTKSKKSSTPVLKSDDAESTPTASIKIETDEQTTAEKDTNNAFSDSEHEEEDKSEERKKNKKKEVEAPKNWNWLSSDRSRRSIKKRYIFDPSDYEKAPKNAKRITQARESDEWIEESLFQPVKRRELKSADLHSAFDHAMVIKQEKDEEEFCLCEVCNTDINAVPKHCKPTKTRTCAKCQQVKAHGFCVLAKDKWQCYQCRMTAKCVLCDSPGKGDPMLECSLCQDIYHLHCGNASEVPSNWFCQTCQSFTQLFNDEPIELRKRLDPDEKMKGTSKKSEKRPLSPVLNLAYPKIVDSESEDEEVPDEVPDCSEWTHEQVHSYFQMFVPTQDAQIFLDEKIDGKSLVKLDKEDFITFLRKINLKLGPALKMFAVVKRLQVRSYDISHAWY